jgi:sugar lactone lactonase YvrE
MGKHCVTGLLLALAAASTPTWSAGAALRPVADVLIDGKSVHPESITSTRDGSLYIGSVPGIVYRATAAEATATPFIRPDAVNGLGTVFGVLADEKAGLLWVCTIANPFLPRPAQPLPPTAVVAFDLKSGQFKGRWPFPAPTGVCNDIAVDRNGNLYATDTPNGRILKLDRSRQALTVVAEDAALKGIDGLAFAGDGQLYVNIVSSGELLRVEWPRAGAPAVLTRLKLTRPLAGPDGFRPVGGNRFLVAEGTGGRIDLVTIDWDIATVRVLRDGLQSSPGVTAVGKTAYAVEGKIDFLVDPKRRGQDPGEFKALAIPFE